MRSAIAAALGLGLLGGAACGSRGAPDACAGERAVALRAELDQARAAEAAGDVERGLAIATRIAPATETTNCAPLVAGTFVVLGKLQTHAAVHGGAARSFRSAAAVAARAGDTTLEREALAALVAAGAATPDEQRRLDALGAPAAK